MSGIATCPPCVWPESVSDDPVRDAREHVGVVREHQHGRVARDLAQRRADVRPPVPQVREPRDPEARRPSSTARSSSTVIPTASSARHIRSPELRQS